MSDESPNISFLIKERLEILTAMSRMEEGLKKADEQLSYYSDIKDYGTVRDIKAHKEKGLEILSGLKMELSLVLNPKLDTSYAEKMAYEAINER